jgi:two-component system response regulator HydG
MNLEPVVLIVDDEAAARQFCAEALNGLDFRAEAVPSARDALRVLERGGVDIVLTDLVMPEMSGMELLRQIQSKHPQVDVVIMTGYGSIPSAVEAIRQGAYDYLSKPFKAEDLERVMLRLLEKQQLLAENRLLREQLRSQQGFASLVGTSAKMQKVYRLILKVAPRRHPVLIVGESGTGKELVARAIHTYSPWKDKAFVPIDCGALSPTLIESELFGHVRGAFTGATQTRAGLLAEAHGGTLFLDEIAELPVELQVKLLRALQEREIKPLGSNERRRLDARIIAATNQDLEECIRHGTFRKDLYYRLNVFSIRIPPLRERKSDIPVLVHHFLERDAVEGPISGITQEAMSRLLAYDWPGNVRELENSVQRALALATGPMIKLGDLPSPLRYHVQAEESSESVPTLRELERTAILQALEAAQGDRVRAAKLLGIGKTTIYRKLKEYGIEDVAAPAGSRSN